MKSAVIIRYMVLNWVDLWRLPMSIEGNYWQNSALQGWPHLGDSVPCCGWKDSDTDCLEPIALVLCSLHWLPFKNKGDRFGSLSSQPSLFEPSHLRSHYQGPMYVSMEQISHKSKWGSAWDSASWVACLTMQKPHHRQTELWSPPFWLSSPRPLR